MSLVKDSYDLKTSEKDEDYRVYGYRYVIAVIYSLAAIQNILMWLVFGPLTTTVASIYGQSITIVNLGTILISNISYIPSNFVATYIIDTYGLKFGTICGGVLTTIGLWIRFFCKEGFLFIFIGQCFAGVAQPFFYTTPQKISNVWFGPKERTLATTAIAVSLNIGNALGAFLPQFFVDFNETDNNKLLDQIKTLMLCTAIAGSVVLGLTIVIFREKPPTPPSKGAKATKLNYWRSLGALFKDLNAMVFIIATAANSGAMVTFMSVLQPLVASYGISADAVSNILFIGIFIGFIGAGFVGYYVNATKKYKLVTILLCAACTALLVGNYFTAKIGNPYIFGVSFCIYILFITPVMPLGLETGVELSFPVAEATSGGVWFVFNQGLSTGESLAIDAILDNADPSEPNKAPLMAFIIMTVYQLVSCLLLFFVKQNLKRTKFEKQSLLELGEGERAKLVGKAVMSTLGGARVVFEDDINITSKEGI